MNINCLISKGGNSIRTAGGPSLVKIENHKKSIFASTFITVLVVAMLIISGPAQAVSVTIAGLQNSYKQGNDIDFQVKIEINDPDRFVPITNISLNLTGPSNKNIVFNLDGTPISNSNIGIIKITPVSKPQPADFGYGYGYGVDNTPFGYGYGYDFGYGYGYGYGYGGGKLSYIYNVTINTTSLSVGSYRVVASLNTGNAAKPSFDSAPATFKITIPADIRIEPRTLNLASAGGFTAFITLPSQYKVSEIDNATVVCEGAHLVSWNIANDGKFIAKFRVQDLVNVPTGNAVKLTVTGNLKDGKPFEGSDTIRVISQGQTLGGGGGSGGGSGGGGVVTSEPFENILKYETRDCDLTAGKPSSCKFSTPEHWVSELVITGKESETASFRIEALKGLSPKVNKPAPGTKYLSIWPGSQRIQEALIRFRVDNSWIASEGLTAENLRMYRWDGTNWIELETGILSREASTTSYEAKTIGFSYFAISGLKAAAVQTTPSITAPAPPVTPEGTPAGTQSAAAAGSPINLYIIIGAFIVILAVLVLYFVRKK